MDHYAFADAQMMRKQISLVSDVFEMWLISLAFYTPDLEAHKYFSSVPGSARVAGPFVLEDKTVSDLAVWNYTHPVFSPVTGIAVSAVLIVHRTTTDALSELWAIQTSGPGLPTTPLTAVPVAVQVDAGADKAGAIRDAE